LRESNYYNIGYSGKFYMYSLAKFMKRPKKKTRADKIRESKGKLRKGKDKE